MPPGEKSTHGQAGLQVLQSPVSEKERVVMLLPSMEGCYMKRIPVLILVIRVLSMIPDCDKPVDVESEKTAPHR